MQSPSQPAKAIELSTIQAIPTSERHGKSRDLFTVWFGSNIMLLTVVTGALAVTIFGLSFIYAVLAIVIGHLVGGIFMALHSAQGPQLGVPQMVQTRGQFGSYGSLLVVVLVVVMYLGFFASNAVLGGQSLHGLFPALSINGGIVLVSAFSVLATIFGYRLIHGYTRVMSYFSGSILLLTFIWIVFISGLPENFMHRGGFNWPGFFGTLSVAALWQLAYAPYVSDYSRYMPEGTGNRTAFWASYSGCCLGSIFPMLLGVVVALCIEGDDIVGGIATMTGGISFLVLATLSIGVAATNAMNCYCGALSTITVGQTLFPNWSAGAGSRAIVALVLFSISLALALLGKDDFMTNYTNFILLLLYVLVPWTAINLVDYYLVMHGSYDVPSFFRRDGGVYGYFNWTAVVCYFIGIVVQIPFMSTDIYMGYVAEQMNGADISWIVGILVISPLYYWLASRRQKALSLQNARSA